MIRSKFNRHSKSIRKIMKQNLKLSIILLAFNLIHTKAHDKKKDIIYILDYTKTDTEILKFMHKAKPFEKKLCAFNNCFVTDKRDYFNNITNFDVFLFDVKDLKKPIDIDRKPWHRYVFIAQDSAAEYPVNRLYSDGFFNLTWTYKLDSDAIIPHVKVKSKVTNEFVAPKVDMEWLSVEKMNDVPSDLKKKLQTKKIAAAWFVDCNMQNDQIKYYNKLSKALNAYGHRIDLYGKCGHLKCVKDQENVDACYRFIELDYYFYLAFESSVAEDYVTDKIVTALQHYAVPIVYGGANYSSFMPNGIYLDARSKPPKELAQEMISIIKEPQKYYDFFKWHQHYSYVSSKENYIDDVCRLCEMLNVVPDGEYLDFERWWNEPKDWPATFISQYAVSESQQDNEVESKPVQQLVYDIPEYRIAGYSPQLWERHYQSSVDFDVPLR